MKIALIEDHIPSKWAHSINTMKHAQGFKDLGHHVEILSLQGFKELLNKIVLKNIYSYYKINQDIKIKCFLDLSLNFFREIRFIGPFFEIISNLLQTKLPKIYGVLDIHKKISDYCCKENIGFSYCRRLGRIAYLNILNKIPTVYESHDLSEINNLNYLLKVKNNPYFKAIVTIHESLKQKFIEIGFPKRKIITLEDAVDLKNYIFEIDKKKLRKTLNLPQGKKIILYVGSLQKGRGIELIIKSARLLADKDFIFLVIGGEKKKVKYWKKISKIQKRENVYFFGFKENKLIPYYLKAADVLIAPYESSCPTLKWMSPIKIYEYMASNVPIITSDANRIKQICDKDECLLFKIDDFKDLAKKIEILINDNTLQEILKKNALEKVKNHTYTERCNRILKFTLGF